MNIEPAIPLDKGLVLSEIQCFENGSFSLAVRSDDGLVRLQMYNSLGQKVDEIMDLDGHLTGIVLGDNYTIVSEQKKRLGQDVPEMDGALYDNKKNFLLGHIKDVRVYANNWYALVVDGQTYLYNDKHQQVASDFLRAEVFSLGYMLQSESLFGDREWTQYLIDGTPVRWYSQVKAFLGDGNILQWNNFADSQSSDFYAAFCFDGRKLTDRNIVDVVQFANGRFVLHFSDGACRMYQPDGTPLSAVVPPAKFFPDGSFMPEDSLGICMYAASGIMDRRTAYYCECAGDCYAISNEKEEGVLYDSNGEKIGEKYERIKACNRFSLWLHDQRTMEMFFGSKKVFSWQRCE